MSILQAYMEMRQRERRLFSSRVTWAVRCLSVALVAMLFVCQSLASSSSKKVNRISAAEAAEHKIPVEFNAQGIGKKEIDIIFKDSMTYIPVAEAFTFLDRKSTRLNSSHIQKSRMPSSA